ncbi:MAG: hypothetical protein LBG17_01995 [Bacteroidales bacterium]|jgi:hypothetical protein|nr:hypothetical protein [Bacteroidales bacterium]
MKKSILSLIIATTIMTIVGYIATRKPIAIEKEFTLEKSEKFVIKKKEMIEKKSNGIGLLWSGKGFFSGGGTRNEYHLVLSSIETQKKDIITVTSREYTLFEEGDTVIVDKLHNYSFRFVYLHNDSSYVVID